MSDIVEELRNRYMDTKRMIPCDLEHRAANQIEALRHQLEMAEACLAGDNALIVGLKNDIAEKDAEIDSYKTSYESTHAQNLRLADQLGESAAEIERLKSENRKLALYYLSAEDQALEHWQQLAASQAREQQLREKLTRIANPVDGGALPWDIAADAIALPQDTTALEAIITKAGEVMRDMCIEVIDCEAIRSLPPITLKDLE